MDSTHILLIASIIHSELHVYSLPIMIYELNIYYLIYEHIIYILMNNLDSNQRNKAVFTCTAGSEYRLILISWRRAVESQQFRFGYKLSPKKSYPTYRTGKQPQKPMSPQLERIQYCTPSYQSPPSWKRIFRVNSPCPTGTDMIGRLTVNTAQLAIWHNVICVGTLSLGTTSSLWRYGLNSFWVKCQRYLYSHPFPR